MPNIDGGHYFLTVLAPIRTDTLIDPVVGRSRSHVHSLAQKLALMAVGPQTAETPPDVWPSPFSKNKLNHFARFVIVYGPNYNGRDSGDAVIATLTGVNPLAPQPDDELSRPYLVFATDFDAPTATEADLTAYATALWETMSDDLTVIFDHCCGFAGTKTAAAFAAYLRSCQVETTFPFNDYWADGLKVPPGKPPIGLTKWTAILGLVTAGVGLVGKVLEVVLKWAQVRDEFTAKVVPLTLAWVLPLAWSLPVAFAFLLLFVLSLFLLYRWAMTNGAKPFPRAPGSDLATILKALFLQQALTRFAIEAQGLSDADLHVRFGNFLAATKPDDVNDPPTFAGRFRAPHVEWTR